MTSSWWQRFAATLGRLWRRLVGRRPLPVRVEVWPLAADPAGVWLVSDTGDAWRSPLIDASSEPHRAVEALVRERAPGGLTSLSLCHSTSWRVDGRAVVLTYVAVLGSHGEAGSLPLGGYGEYGYAREVWPTARPVGLPLAEDVGRPPWHHPAEAPAPRHVDVLLHAVRHLRFLMDTDTSAQAALDVHWQHHLLALRPALAGMYERPLGA